MEREILLLANFENFTGKDGQSWGQWYRRFRAKTVTFSEESRQRGLVSLLQDGALDHFATLSEEVQSSLQRTVASLEARFGTAKNAMQAHAELANIRQQPGEATRDFADRVRQVGREAYPGARAGDPSVEATVVSRFVCGLREEELQTRVLRKDPSSLTEAMGVADKFQQQQDALRVMRRPIGGEALAVRDRDAPGTARLDALERPSSGCVEDTVTSNESETESACRCKGGSTSIDIAGQPDRQTAQASGEVNSADEVAGREVRAVSRPGVDGEAGDTSPVEQSNRQRAKDESPPRNHARQDFSHQTPSDISMPEECSMAVGTEVQYAQSTIQAARNG
ncbi:hypothetical protein FJT64_005289 [Amphibalanus amphitrite]|uniref:Retrotransposon gag domain-containing protein n=1 Tax=Amphibalanus amphitrite TaxID=1232801 RepID=A0A6A4VM00_AMPAM|nr:hypothetical protein FJT64_005289 [Amphibalanus amphitrite]